MTTLVWQRTTYSDGHQEYPAVYVRWDDVTAYLGRPHDGDPDQDARLVQGLLESGAPDWVQDAPGWIDEHGWGLYLNSQSNWQYMVIQDQEGNLFADKIVVSEESINLDEWDGSNWRTGGMGLHEQVHKVLKAEGEAVDGMYLVYRWSQWQGQQPDALLLTKKELADHLKELGRDVEEYLPKIAELVD
jgi:hypothetical protein